MYRKICLSLVSSLVSCATFSKPIVTNTAIYIEQIPVVKQIKKLEAKEQDFTWDIDDFAKTWQLYVITNPKLELAKHYDWQIDEPIGINFTDSQFKSIHTCSTITGNYRLSALDKGGLIIDNMNVRPHACLNVSKQKRQQQEKLFTSFIDGITTIIPVKIQGKKEKVLKIQTEDYNYIFRSIKNPN